VRPRAALISLYKELWWLLRGNDGRGGGGDHYLILVASLIIMPSFAYVTILYPILSFSSIFVDPSLFFGAAIVSMTTIALLLFSFPFYHRRLSGSALVFYYIWSSISSGAPRLIWIQVGAESIDAKGCLDGN